MRKIPLRLVGANYGNKPAMPATRRDCWDKCSPIPLFLAIPATRSSWKTAACNMMWNSINRKTSSPASCPSPTFRNLSRKKKFATRWSSSRCITSTSGGGELKSRRTMPPDFVSISLQCERCTACCRWPGDVCLSTEEITRLAAFKRLTESDFIQHVPRLRRDRRGLALVEQPDGACVFLEGRNCAVQPVKPQQCTEFPNRWINSLWGKVPLETIKKDYP